MERVTIRRKKIVDPTTPFQKQFLTLTFEDFVKKTNIGQIAIACLTKEYIASGSPITKEGFEKKLQQLFNDLQKVTQWEELGLSNLQLIPTEVANASGAKPIAENVAAAKTKNATSLKNVTNAEPVASTSKHPQSAQKSKNVVAVAENKSTTKEPNAEHTASTLKGSSVGKTKQKRTNQDASKSADSVDTSVEIGKKRKKRNRDVQKHEPSDFQKEVLKLDYNQFISDTNIQEIIEKEYHAMYPNADGPIPEEKSQKVLKFYFDFRKNTDDWQKNGLRNLQFKTCQCKRDKKFANKKIQCSIAKKISRSTQCGIESVELDKRDAPKSETNSVHVQTTPCTENDSNRERKNAETQCNENSLSSAVRSTNSSQFLAPNERPPIQHPVESQTASQSTPQINSVHMSQLASENFLTYQPASRDPLLSQTILHNDNVQSLALSGHQSVSITQTESLVPSDKGIRHSVSIRVSSTLNEAASAQYGLDNGDDGYGELDANIEIGTCDDNIDNRLDFEIDQPISDTDSGAITNAQPQQNVSGNDIHGSQPRTTILDDLIASVRNDNQLRSDAQGTSTQMDETQMSETQMSIEQQDEQDVLDDSMILVENEIVIKQEPTSPKASRTQSLQDSDVQYVSPPGEEVIDISEEENTQALFYAMIEPNRNQETNNDSSDLGTSNTPAATVQSPNLLDDSIEEELDQMFAEIPAPDDQEQLNQENRTQQSDKTTENPKPTSVNETFRSPNKVSGNKRIACHAVEIELNNNGNILKPINAEMNVVTIVQSKRKNPFRIREKKKRKAGADDTLSTIQVPKYNYNPLQLVVDRRSDENGNLPMDSNAETDADDEPQIDESDDTPPSSMRSNPRDFVIEEFNSSTEDSSQSQRNSGNSLPSLSIENTLFLQVNTQSSQNQKVSSQTAQEATAQEATSQEITANASQSLSRVQPEIISNRIVESVTSTLTLTPAKILTLSNCAEGNAGPSCFLPPQPKKRKTDTASSQIQDSAVENTIAPVTAFLQTNAGPSVNALTSTTSNAVPRSILTMNPFRVYGDHFEFLHHIDIERIVGTSHSVMLNAANNNFCQQFIEMKAVLRFQCNGDNRVTLTGDSPRKVLKLTVREWRGVQEILHVIRDFTFDARAPEPNHRSVLHRALYYLFKTSSRFSNIMISYRDEDREYAQVLNTRFDLIRPRRNNLDAAIDPYVLKCISYR